MKNVSVRKRLLVMLMRACLILPVKPARRQTDRRRVAHICFSVSESVGVLRVNEKRYIAESVMRGV